MAKIDQEILRGLTNCPAGDLNFRHRLKEADEPTIMAAIEALEGNPDNKTAVKELRTRLQKLRAMALETYDHHTAVLKMADVTFQAEREADQKRMADQTVREGMIAQCHEVIGRIQGVEMLSKMATVASLVWMRDMKAVKAYRDVPNIGTWDKFCEYLGKDRRTVDEDLQNLAIFGEQFLETVANLQVGYRELRQLRQLTHDGSVILDGDQLCIPDESPIPIDQDHAEELQAAIERIITANNETKKRVDKLEKDFKGAVKEETHGLQSEKKALLERVKALEIYEPSETDREWSVKQMQVIEDAAGALQIAIAKFIIDPRVKEDRHLQANVSAHLQEAELALHDVRTRMDDVIDMFRD